MAVTIEKDIYIKNGIQRAYPVASGETIYKGTIAVVFTDGYLYNGDATSVATGRVAVVVADGSANASGPAATTANGSISGSKREASADAGDKTVRVCYVAGEVEFSGQSGFSQSDVGALVYASDNYTLTTTSTSNILVGRISKYISATEIAVELTGIYA